jgi:hypothetical protein
MNSSSAESPDPAAGLGTMSATGQINAFWEDWLGMLNTTLRRVPFWSHVGIDLPQQLVLFSNSAHGESGRL